MAILIRPSGPYRGQLRVPGDKSISHRSLIFASLAHGRSVIRGLLESADVSRTAACLKAWGVSIENRMDGLVIVSGLGVDSFCEPDHLLDCGNSGTSIRLLLGLAGSRPFASCFVGDASLSRRPMARVTKPLSDAGVRIIGRDSGNLLPIAVQGPLESNLTHRMSVASAQVKSSLLLAGLNGERRVVVEEPASTRDHTERMLAARGVRLAIDGNRIEIQGPQSPRPLDCVVPSDPSSAAFHIVAASIIPDSDLVLTDVCVNETRTGILEVLQEMGARIEITDRQDNGGEPVASIRVRTGELTGIEIADPRLIPRLIDEIPVLAVAASFATGRTVIRNAEELRAKESDRIRSMVTELTKMDVRIEELDDGMIIHGPCPPKGGRVESHGDHRVAMSLAVGALASVETHIDGFDCIDISYPGFLSDVRKVARNGEDHDFDLVGAES